ncbi:MAG: hypothetical protein KKB45_12245 [Gammaproteobacteria bacterium]|jgi:hypothetical protein|nr:hypothetical protein [Gammaproteobacteria bacterium]
MMRWYRRYLVFLNIIAKSQWPTIGWIWGLMLCSLGWTGYWLLAEQRVGGELLLPLLSTLWLLIWLFIRLIFNFGVLSLPENAGWKRKLSRGWYYFKLHGTACLILLLILGCLLISLKLAAVLWRSFN